MSKFKFTKQSVTANDLPIGTHYDTDVKGLVLNVTAATRKFGVYLWVHNAATRKSIGDISDWSITAVREEAVRVIQELKKPKQAALKVTTLQDLADSYTRKLEISGKRDTGYILDAMRLSWSHLAKRDVNTITKIELQDAHDKIAITRGKSAARGAVMVVRMLLNYAIDDDLLNRNVARRVTTYPEVCRDTFLNEREVIILRECLTDMAPDPRDFFTLALLTGLRRSNIGGMRKEWIDFPTATITIPSAFSKNKTDMVFPLVPEALSIIKARMDSDSPFIFPSKYSRGCVQQCYTWLDDLRARMAGKGVKQNFTTHDLRRTFASRLVTTGASLPVIAKALGHIGLSSVHIYARTDVASVREALSRV